MGDSKATIGASICAVMAEIKRLKKADKNDFAKYLFTSVDDFKDEVRPLMAKHGLLVNMNELSLDTQVITNDKGKETLVSSYKFSIELEHAETGDKQQAENITIMLPYTGAQTTGAARSYALKEWFKSKFLASSGDQGAEADHNEQAQYSTKDRLGKPAARELSGELDKELNELANKKDIDALRAWWPEQYYRIETLPKDWEIALKTRWQTAGKELKANEDLDKMSNEQLDEIAMGKKPTEAA
ncbi:ERF family protein [Lentilitoribacter sp. Alg239-R112]|uniref:ERF family protein n=1 Tax=Lentilitoribacter sp. Alg239-R112 TaxID=2305987 RepID=UPI0013A6BB2E|nr:ERF family protein [Lentilitoribacter sp. Alg239-R112]